MEDSGVPDDRLAGLRRHERVWVSGMKWFYIPNKEIAPQGLVAVEGAGVGSPHEEQPVPPVPPCSNGVGVGQIPLTSDAPYIELGIIKLGEERKLTVGVASEDHPLNQMPGSLPNSVGYRVDGVLFTGSSSGAEFGGPIENGDSFGVGVDFVTASVFFTRNGRLVGSTPAPFAASGVAFLTIGFSEMGEAVHLNPTAWHETTESHAGRHARIRSEGAKLYYDLPIGAPAGIFQTNAPLGPGNPYFEATLDQPGRTGSIFIGLASANHRMDRPPGWDASSVGIRLGNGYVFVESEEGRDIGVKCNQGDRIGFGLVQGDVPVIVITVNDSVVGRIGDVAKPLLPTVCMTSPEESVTLRLDLPLPEAACASS